MVEQKQSHFFGLVVCAFLTACGSAGQPQGSPSSLYELPKAPTAQHPVIIDNDSYYVQPSGYTGCNNINDAPSCGGG